ncbi:MAG: CHAD domain-containing protein [Burkholderiales bacterium]|nr:CHAD domain-containing protein [Burkholderiales bacterium]
MTPDQALRAIVAAAFAQLRANEPGVLLSDDPEYVHQMRVAIRRMRSALRLFDHGAARELRKRRGSALKGLASVLGRSRDLDVFAAAVAPVLRDVPAAQARRARAAIRARVREARDAARAHLRSPAHERLMTHLALWLAAPAEAHARQGALLTLARRMLEVQARKVTRGAARFSALDDEARHDLRIEIKRARYAAEFFADLFDRAAAKSYAGALATAQDSLGSLTDIKTAQALLRDFGFDGAVESRILGAWIDHAAGAEAALGRAFAACSGAQGYWKRQH